MPPELPELKQATPQTVYVRYIAPTQTNIAKIEYLRDTACGIWTEGIVQSGYCCQFTFMGAYNTMQGCDPGDEFDFQGLTFWPEAILNDTYGVARSFLDGKTGSVFFNPAKIITGQDPGKPDESYPVRFIDVSMVQSDKLVFTVYNRNYSERYYRIGFEITLKDSSGKESNDRFYTSRDPEIQLDKKTG